ncbi:Calmodulin [Symbiodinium microadriaticum]|uniref:Calmodulin n=1 Tax=Symbiodinium microadriaticum TaxID=2951 RepID=A0A1Q9EZE0_SYMMI|nr:Calmodulin [Symbiodinium microadriaticum]
MFSKSQRLPRVEGVSRSFSGQLSTTTSTSGGNRSRPQSAGSSYGHSLRSPHSRRLAPPLGGTGREEVVMAEYFTEEQIAEYKVAFDDYDIDGGGSISTSELGTAMRALGACPSDEELWQWINDVDKDGNGELDFQEFLNLMSKMVGRDPYEELSDALKVFDRQGDGHVSVKELKHVLTRMGDVLTSEEVDEWLVSAEVSPEGQINIERFLEQFFGFLKKNCLHPQADAVAAGGRQELQVSATAIPPLTDLADVSPLVVSEARSTASSCGAIRVMSRQVQAQELKRPPPVHAWNHLEPTSFIPVADRWTTQLSQNGDEISCSLPSSLVGVLQGMWRDSVARGCRYLCVLEICYNGEKRQLTTKHKPEKYNTYAGNITDLVSREFSFMAMEQMHCSRHYGSLSKAPRRLGACEVYLLMPDGVDNSQSCMIFLGHSKLTSLQWPNCSNLKMRFLSVLPNIVRRVLELRSHDWSVHEGQAVMKEAAAWGLERWDALEGLADKVDAGNRVLESGQQASRNNDKDALREAIHDCHELQLADELIEGWMDELKQKNMSVFNLKSQAKRFQRNAAFSAAVRVKVHSTSHCITLLCFPQV